ncbi:Presequence protease 1, chloroplastic/mitochondrial [Turnera subulata]|uniref:Presequence protease 1, chloroplastic/mitochondrial n=1 Tax=Turnera subulata TaxID=218843 RepID=A0A9Q0FZQ7_9ROSI|nr:Presequence protease 1, chloroplastic/mitochondrial [Turnera subulata]
MDRRRFLSCRLPRLRCFSSSSYQYSSPVSLHRPIPAHPRHSLLRRSLSNPSASLSSLCFNINSYGRRHFSSLSTTLAVSSPPAHFSPDAAGEIPNEVAEKFGFEKVSEELIGECKSRAILLRHRKTGAEVMSVSNDDDNKVFGIVFRTPPKDSTGIFHVLGRSVLLGSRKYPLVHTFDQLPKGSLQTFLNAFICPDRTCYPVASPNTKDFYNLVDVYLDAVFFPMCVHEPDYNTFQHEGWFLDFSDHQEEESDETNVLINRGCPLINNTCLSFSLQCAYSSATNNIENPVHMALFPDNAYRFDSGGDPKVIPKLAFEQFKEFHQKYYHPSNARIWFYGDDDPTERLRILSEYLDMFDASSTPNESKIEPPKLFSEPVRIVRKYPASDGTGDFKKKHMVWLNWLLSDKPLDLETEVTLRLLDHLMLGTPASPLRKILLESGLGESIIGRGVEDDLLQPRFSIGLNGVSEYDIRKVEELIMDTFVKLAEEGFETDAVEASLNTFEFSLRGNNTKSFLRGLSLLPPPTDKFGKEKFKTDVVEASMNTIELSLRDGNTESFPRGLSLMLRSIGKWIYDMNPFEPLKYEKPLVELKARIAKQGSIAVFSPLIKMFILNNSHRVTVEMQPDPEKATRDEAEEREILDRVKASMFDAHGRPSDDLYKLSNASYHVVCLKGNDPPEALKSVPSLSLQDIPKEPTHVSSEVGDVNGVKVLQHNLFTDDILHSEVVFNMRSLKQELLPLLPLFCQSLLEMGTKDMTSIQLNQLIERKTGGLSVYPFNSSVRALQDPCSHIIVRGKAMASHAEDLFNLINCILQEVQLTDQQRFKQFVHQNKAKIENRLREGDCGIVASRMDAKLNTAGWIFEQMGFISYLEYLQALEEKIDQDWAGVSSSLEEIRRSVLTRNGCLVNMTADGKTLSHSEKYVSKFLNLLPSNSSVAAASWNARLASGNEAFLIPTQLSCMGKAANLFDTGYQLHGSAYVITKCINSTWFKNWDFSGKAYGGFCDFNTHSGVFSFLCNKSKNLLKTLEAFDRTCDFLRHVETIIDDDTLTKEIIRSIEDEDAYQLPDAKGYSRYMGSLFDFFHLLRYLQGITEEERKRRREEILSTSLKDFKEFASAIEAVKDKWVSVAVASPEVVEAANRERSNYFQVKKIF